MSQTSYRVNLTEGSVPKLLIRFAWPMLVQNVIQSCYSLADSMWLGRLVGSQALAAVSVSNPVSMVIISFVLAIFMASTLIIAQYAGAADREGVTRTINTGLTFALIGGAFMTVAGIVFCTPILRVINTPPSILEHAAVYLRIIFMGGIFVFGYNAVGAILRGLGDSRSAMWFALIAAATNIVLDPIFIAPWGLGLGIAGAAWATILSQGLAFALAFLYMVRVKKLIRLERRTLSIDRTILGKMFKLGLPMSVQQTLLSVMFLFVTFLINGFGEAAVAANGIIGRIDSFAFMPSFAFSGAISTVTGQNLGALRFDRARQTLWWGTLFNAAIAAVVSVAVFAFVPVLASIFLDPGEAAAAEVVRLAVECERVAVWTYVLFSVMHANNGFINGSGGTFFIMVLTIVTQYVVRMPLAYVLSQTALGMKGVYLAMYATPVISVAFSSWYISRGKWRRRLIDSTPKTNGPSEQEQESPLSEAANELLLPDSPATNE